MYTYNVPHGLRNKKIKVLKKLFAVQMRWISADEPDAHDDADLEDSGDALVPADEVDDDVAERDDDVPGAINDLGHHDAAPDAGESSGAESSMNVRSLYQICHSISLSLSLFSLFLRVYLNSWVDTFLHLRSWCHLGSFG